MFASFLYVFIPAKYTTSGPKFYTKLVLAITRRRKRVRRSYRLESSPNCLNIANLLSKQDLKKSDFAIISYNPFIRWGSGGREEAPRHCNKFNCWNIQKNDPQFLSSKKSRGCAIFPMTKIVDCFLGYFIVEFVAVSRAPGVGWSGRMASGVGEKRT